MYTNILMIISLLMGIYIYIRHYILEPMSTINENNQKLNVDLFKIFNGDFFVYQVTK